MDTQLPNVPSELPASAFAWRYLINHDKQLYLDLTLVRITDLLEKGGDKTDVKAAVGARTKVEAPAKPAKAKKAKAEASAEAASE